MTRLTILSHADFSGRIKRSRRNPGFAAFATFVDNIRSADREGTLLLDAGDSFCTNFWPGEPCVRAEGLLGPDAMVLGNHELDKGKDFLEDCIAKTSFPILCSNIVERSTGRPVKGTRPYVILERKGLRIGILGITTAYTPYMVTATSFEPFKALDPIETSKRLIPQIRKEGVDLLLLLAHVPFYVDDSGKVTGELAEILDAIPKVDWCMGGHIPGDYAGLYNGTILLKGGFSGHSLCKTSLEVEDGSIKSDQVVLSTDWSIAAKPEYQACEDAIVKPFLSFFNDVIGISDRHWSIRLSRETELGDWLASSLREAAGSAIAYMNATSAGGEIAPGPFTAEDLTSVMGFNDCLYTTHMKGQDIWDLIETVYDPECFGNNAGIFFSGIIVSIDHTRPAYSKVQSICLENGTPLEMNMTYTVGTSEYMSTGGNGTKKVAGRFQWTNTHVRMHDAMLEKARREGVLKAEQVKRLIEIGTPENDNAPY